MWGIENLLDVYEYSVLHMPRAVTMTGALVIPEGVDVCRRVPTGHMVDGCAETWLTLSGELAGRYVCHGRPRTS